jgi:hypothetical protein
VSEVLDMVYAMRGFENINEETKNGYRVMCEVGFQHLTDRQWGCCHETEGGGRVWGLMRMKFVLP